MDELYYKNKQRAKKETIEWLLRKCSEERCNYALTINPNNGSLKHIDLIEQEFRKIEKRIKSRCYRNKCKRKEFFYIAVVEHSYVDSYHLHLSLRIPEGTELSFEKHIEKAIKDIFPRSSYELKKIYDLVNWGAYITKQQLRDDLHNHYFFNAKESWS